MSEQTDRLTQLLIDFGLDKEETNLYLYLVKNGPQTVLRASRDLGMARTKVYRLLDNLYDKKMVDQELRGRGLKFEARPYQNLELLILEQENKVNSLKNSLPTLYKELERISYIPRAGSKILYYSGINGLKQVTWNSLKAKNELCLFEIKNMSAFLDFGFCEEVRREFVNRRIHVRELSNQKRMPGWTKIYEFPKKFWQCRFLDPRMLEMKFEILIYNNVVCLYNYKDKEIFCVEIYDESLSQMQRQVFDFMWEKARKMKIVNKNGEAVVEKQKRPKALGTTKALGLETTR